MASLLSLEEKYDPNAVIQAANDKLHQENDLEGGQMIFQSALLTWVDDAREQQQQQQNSHWDASEDPLTQAVATLWLGYAHYLAAANQNRSAMQAYEQAVACPVAGIVGRVWMDYARFAEERGRFRTAQNVYIRALVGNNNNKNSGGGATTASSSGGGGAVTDEQDIEMLWQEFLEMMRRQKSDSNLTLEALQSAIESEHFSAAATETDQEQNDETMQQGGGGGSGEPQAKRVKLESSSALASETTTTTISNKTHVIMAEAVEKEAKVFLEQLQKHELPADVLASWLMRDGTAPATAPEPPLFEASPPKLSDSTGKDWLGSVELALRVNRRLLRDVQSGDGGGGVVLHACRGLWTLALLTEQRCDAEVQSFNKNWIEQYQKRQAEWKNRLSVAGPAKVAVEQMNARELQVFAEDCRRERQAMMQTWAWEFRRLLCIQQQVLHKLDMPGWDARPTAVDESSLVMQAKIAGYLHSAFYLRSRIGEAPYRAHVENLVKRLEGDLEQQQKLGGGPVGASRGHSPVAPPTNYGGGGSAYAVSSMQLPPPSPPLATPMLPPMPAVAAYGGGGGMALPNYAYPLQQQQPGMGGPPSHHMQQQQHMPTPPHMQQQQHLPLHQQHPPPPHGGPPQYPPPYYRQ